MCDVDVHTLPSLKIAGKFHQSGMEVEIVSDSALKLRYCKLTVTRTDVYGGLLLLLQQLEDIAYKYTPCVLIQ